MSASAPVKRLISSRGVATRYGQKALRSVRRWEIDGVIPPPDKIIRGRKYWWLETLERHERQRVADSARGTI